MEDLNEYLLAVDYGNCFIKTVIYDWSLNKSTAFEKIVPTSITLRNDDQPLQNTAYIMENGTILGDGGGRFDCTRVSSVKKHIGDENWNVSIPQRKHILMNAYDIMKESFEYIYDTVENQTFYEFSKAIVTVPVCFSEMQRRLLESAVKREGYEIQEIITEPFAGMFSCYEIFEGMQDGEEQWVLIFDAGGSTIDMCLFDIKRKGNQFDVRNTAAKGLRFGGDDITEWMYQTYMKEAFEPVLQQEALKTFQARYPEKYRPKEGTEEFQKAFDNCWKESFDYHMSYMDIYKIALSNHSSKPEEKVNFERIHYIKDVNIQLSYDELVKMLDDHGMKAQIEEAIKQMISLSNMYKEEISKIVMIGGTSQLHYFRHLLQEFFAIPDEKAEEYFPVLTKKQNQYAVAIGAMVYLLNSENRFIVKSRAPYEVGILEENGFRCLRDKSLWCGDESNPRMVKLQKKGNGVLGLKMYQRFEEDGELYPMGEFLIEEATFPNAKCRVGLIVTQQNELIGIFYQNGRLENGIKKYLSMEV